jgi:multidrug resistance protein, MATE family
MVRVALPIVIVQVGIMLMGVVDTIMVGHLSKEALAAVAVGNLYYFAFGVFGMGMLMSIDPIVSQAVGAGDDDAIHHAVQRGFAFALVLSVPITLAMIAAESVLHWLRQPAEIVPLAATFSRIMIIGTPPLFLFFVLRQTLQSMSLVRPIIIGIIIANVCNLVLNYMLVFGNWGLPALGVAGSAWSTAISRFVLFLAVLIAALPVVRKYLRPDARAFQLEPLLRMARIGAPIGLHHMLEYGAFAGVMAIMGVLGTVQIASHQVAINLASLTFMFPFGVAQAGGVLVGQAVGRGDQAQARRAAGAALLLGVSFMALCGALFLSMPRLLASLYTDDAAVIALSVLLLRLAGVFQIFDGLQVVAAGVLRGVADTRVPMIIGLLGFWIIGMPISLWLGLRQGQGAVGLWWGLVAGLAVVAFVLLARMVHRLSGDLSRIIIDEQQVESAPLSAVSIERLD